MLIKNTKKIVEKLNLTNFFKYLIKSQSINKTINMKQNYQKIFGKAIKEASDKAKCVDEKIGLWVVPCQERNILFYGCDFGLNRSSIEAVCKDKYLTWLLLNDNQKTKEYSSVLEMKFFNAYNRKKLNFHEPLSKWLYKSIDEKKPLVLSFSDKWGEKEIYKVANKPQVDHALSKLGLKNYFLSTNFVPISREYRIILGRFENNIELLLCLEKEPLRIKGDGKKTINQLILEKLASLQKDVSLSEVWKDVDTQLNWFQLKLNDILASEREINITWRLNHDIGSAKITSVDKKSVPKDILDIAWNAFQVLGMNFGGIDIAKNEENQCLIMGSKTQVLKDLLEYGNYEDLVETTKKVIKERARFHEVEKFEDINLTELKESEVINISTYAGRAKVRKDCIKEVSKKLHFSIKFYSQDYLAIINNNIFMIEFDMGVNNSSVVFACGDKGATPKILNLVEVPCVEHEIFGLPEEDEIGEEGVMNGVLEKFKEWNNDVVLKVRRGGQGVGLYHIKNEVDLEKTLLKEIKNGIVISPYLNIINEYRVLILDENVLCIYKKNRLYVKGDGQSSLSQLIITQVKDSELRNNITEDLLNNEGVDLNQIIPNDEKYLVSWKHNLSYGATPEISQDPVINKRLFEIAYKSAQAIGANFVAVDIVDTTEKGLCVLEINSFPGFYHFVKIYGKENLNKLLEKLLSETARMSYVDSLEQPLFEQFESKIEAVIPFSQEKK